jgi:hypothetical protein
MRVKVSSANIGLQVFILLYSIYELINSSLALNRMPSPCTSTSPLFIFQLTASCCLFLLSITCLLPLSKFNPRILSLFLLISTIGLRICGMVKSFEYSGRYVGECFVDDEVGLWACMQQFMSSMMVGAAAYFTTLARKY